MSRLGLGLGFRYILFYSIVFQGVGDFVRNRSSKLDNTREIERNRLRENTQKIGCEFLSV